jgi:hypothetical protein
MEEISGPVPGQSGESAWLRCLATGTGTDRTNIINSAVNSIPQAERYQVRQALPNHSDNS